MRFIHTADLHLGSPMTTHLAADAVAVRRREVDDSLRHVVDDGLARGGEAVLIVGDLFDSKHTLPHIIQATLMLIQGYAPLPFFYVAGNHEGDLLARQAQLPSNLYILTEDSPAVKLGNICLYATASPAALRTLALQPNAYNIVLLHAAVGERTDKDTVRLRDICELPIDYLALGHYHSFTEYREGERMLAVYCGTPEGRGYDECGDKGYALLDTDRRHATFVKTARRRIADCSVDISQATKPDDIVRLIDEVLTAQGLRAQDMVRVTLTGQVAAGVRRDTVALTARFEGRFFSFALKDTCRLRIDRDRIIADPTLKGEFVRTVLADESLSEEDKQAIINCGLLYLTEGGAIR